MPYAVMMKDGSFKEVSYKKVSDIQCNIYLGGLDIGTTFKHRPGRWSVVSYNPKLSWEARQVNGLCSRLDCVEWLVNVSGLRRERDE